MLLLDKKQKTFKQVKGAEGDEDVVDKDVLFNLHKPASSRRRSAPPEDHDLEQQVADCGARASRDVARPYQGGSGQVQRRTPNHCHDQQHVDEHANPQRRER